MPLSSPHPQSKIIIQHFFWEILFSPINVAKGPNLLERYNTPCGLANSYCPFEVIIFFRNVGNCLSVDTAQRNVSEDLNVSQVLCLYLFVLFVLRSIQPVSNQTNLRALLHFVFLRLHTLLCLASNVFLPAFHPLLTPLHPE